MSDLKDFIIMDGVLIAYHGNDLDVIIPEGITTIGERVFRENTKIRSVVVPYGVKTIEYEAFFWCLNLVKVTLPEGLEAIKARSFLGCKKLKNINLPDSLTEVGGGALSHCIELERVRFPKSVIRPDVGFSQCYELREVFFSDETVDLGELYFSYSTKIRYNEYDNALYLGSENNPYLAWVGSKNNPYLIGGLWGEKKEIDTCLVHPDTKFIGCMATEFMKLKSITIPQGVIRISRSAFSGCGNLTNIVIPDSVISIGGAAFRDCKGLERISIPDSVTSIGEEAFEGCDLLQYNKYDNAYYLGNEKNPYHVLVKAKDTTIDSCIIHENTKIILPYAFKGCVNLTYVNLPNEIVSIEMAFADSQGLTEIQIPEGITSLKGTFKNCSNLKNIAIPSTVVDIDFAFQNCTSLTDIELPKGITNIYGAFDGCSNLTCIQIPDGVTNLDHVFEGCGSLKNIELPESVKIIGDFTFKECKSLKSVKLPTKMRKVGVGAFSGCSSLTDFQLPEGLYQIERETFNGCSNLEKITLPSSLYRIKEGAFSNCKNLKKIVIPVNMLTIGADAFKGCKSLKDVTFINPQTTMEISSFKGCPCVKKVDNVSYLCKKAVELIKKPEDVVILEGTEELIPGLLIKNKLNTLTLPTSLQKIDLQGFNPETQLRGRLHINMTMTGKKTEIADFTDKILKNYLNEISKNEEYPENLVREYNEYIKNEIKKLFPRWYQDALFMEYVAKNGFATVKLFDQALEKASGNAVTTAFLLEIKNKYFPDKKKKYTI